MSQVVLHRSKLYHALREDIQQSIHLIEERRSEIELYMKSHFILQEPSKRETIRGQIPIPQTKEERGFHAGIRILALLNTILENIHYIDRYLQKCKPEEFYYSIGTISKYIDSVQHELKEDKVRGMKYKDFPTQQLIKPILLQKSIYEKLRQVSTDLFKKIIDSRNAWISSVSQKKQERPLKRRRI